MTITEPGYMPFTSRPDLTPYLLHLTKNTNSEDEYSAYDNLMSILRNGKIWGSDTRKGFVKGKRKAACFMDVPFSSLKYVLTPENSNPEKPRYEPYGVAIAKRTAYPLGCRPVLYLSDEEKDSLAIPESELWRVVRFELRKERMISWIHEREWRAPDELKLPSSIPAAFVKTSAEAAKLTKALNKNPDKFKCIPRSVIPLIVVCQGLLP